MHLIYMLSRQAFHYMRSDMYIKTLREYKILLVKFVQGEIKTKPESSHCDAQLILISLKII
jgi:hypothetical protein